MSVYDLKAVNTVIIILKKLSGKTNKKERDENKVKFVRIKKPLKVNELTKLLSKANNSYEDDKFRFVFVAQRDLYKDYKWSKYLRAHEIYYKLIKNSKMTELKNLADVSVGVVTLANDFFILSKEQANKLGIEKRFLKPVITTPSKINSLMIKKEDTNQYIFIANESKTQLSNTNALKYITYGEEKNVTITKGHEKGKIVRGYPKLPALSTKKVWYSLGNRESYDVLVPIHIWNRWYAIWNKDKVYCTDNFYWIKPNKKENLLSLLGLLNSTVTEFFVELIGKTVYGEGVIELRKHIFDEIPILNLEKLSKNEKQLIGNLFLKLCETREKDDQKDELKIRQELDVTIFDILEIKDAKEQVYEELENLRATRKSKKKTEVMIKSD